MTDQPKQPMIDKDSPPTPIDFNANLGSLKVSEYLALQWGEWLKVEKEISKELHKPEHFKPEHLKPEHFKPEHFKPEQLKPEQLKPEHSKPEYFKPEWVKNEHVKVEKEVIKELIKPEGLKVEKEFKPDPLDGLVEQVAQRVVAILKEQGSIKG